MSLIRIRGRRFGMVLLLCASAAAASSMITGAAPAFARSAASPGVRSTISMTSEELDGVFCTSPRNCWSVGSFQRKGATLDQVLHWTGKRWFRVSTPNPGGTRSGDTSELEAVRCTAAKNCWAVGDYRKKGAILDQVLHWTGTRWFTVAVPTPGGTRADDVNVLNDVACTSARSCWAVGAYGTSDDVPTIPSVAFNQALHWNGVRWSLVATPSPGGKARNDTSVLSSIRCASPGDCWAAGGDGTEGNKKFFLRNELLHWNGTRWASLAVPSPGGKARGHFSILRGLSCTSASNCWAAGYYGNPRTPKVLNQLLHWNGRRWATTAMPHPGGTAPGANNVLSSVSCTSATDCWAVGGFGGQNGVAQQNEALRWNGTKWRAVSVPDPGGLSSGDRSMLNSIRCVTPANCWAVGIQQPASKPQHHEILRWNGTRWLAG